MRKALFIIGVGLIAFWAWDAIAFQVDAKTGTNTLPFSPLANVPGQAFFPIAGAAIVTYLAVTR